MALNLWQSSTSKCKDYGVSHHTPSTQDFHLKGLLENNRREAMPVDRPCLSGTVLAGPLQGGSETVIEVTVTSGQLPCVSWISTFLATSTYKQASAKMYSLRWRTVSSKRPGLISYINWQVRPLHLYLASYCSTQTENFAFIHFFQNDDFPFLDLFYFWLHVHECFVTVSMCIMRMVCWGGLKMALELLGLELHMVVCWGLVFCYVL